MPRYTLDDFLSRDEAHAYLVALGHTEPDGRRLEPGETASPISHAQWRYRIRVGYVEPIGLGERVVNGRPVPMTICFTKRMLNEYAAGAETVKPTEAEREALMTLQEAADFLGGNYNATKKRVVSGGATRHKTIGKVTVVLRREIERWAASKGETR